MYNRKSWRELSTYCDWPKEIAQSERDQVEPYIAAVNAIKVCQNEGIGKENCLVNAAHKSEI